MALFIRFPIPIPSSAKHQLLQLTVISWTQLVLLVMASISILIIVELPQPAHGSRREPAAAAVRNHDVAPAALISTTTAIQVGGICDTFVTPNGYKCQEFQVQTEDGYILGMQRISPRLGSGNGKSSTRHKQPVLIQHGVLLDGASWFMNSPEGNLPLILADQGFDVWLANSRGTRSSRRHVTLDPKNPEFWSWTWDELVSYDLPATVDFVHTQTGQSIHYVGHSLGTLIAMASFSEGKLVDKVKSAALLCPVAYLSHISTLLGRLAAKAFVGEVLSLLGLAEFNPKAFVIIELIKSFCKQPGVDCYDLLSAITGKNCCLNVTTLEMFLQNEPQPTSTRNMVHLAQTVRNGFLAKYDYGRADYNVHHYGQPTPPTYNLSNIPPQLPIFLSYGGEDELSDVRDVEMLLDHHFKAREANTFAAQFVEDYAHMDFIMGVNTKDIVYSSVIDFFRRRR